MKAPTLRLALAVLFAAALFAPLRSFADTYQIVPLSSDEDVFFYDMDDAGYVTLQDGNCPGPCYITFLNGAGISSSPTAPVLNWDYGSGICNYPTYDTPCTASYDGYTVTITTPSGVTEPDYVFVASGTNPPQFVTGVVGITGIFAINGSGDIVFDNGFYDEWYEAVDLTTITPEPSSLLLLATGMLALAALGLSRGRPAKVV